MVDKQPEGRLRDLIPPLFFPHRTSFTCVHRDAVVPPIDPQADAWLQQALLLEWNEGSPEDQTDWKQAIELTRKAAERNHWKAMLNLVRLRLEGRGEKYGLPKDEETAVREVEAAMSMGIPDAFDMMGHFYQEGTGVVPNISTAYAFYQYAADAGSPAAQTFIGQKLDANYDDPKAGFWGNEKIGRQMMECAFAQGYGPAAYQLGISYAVDNTPESKGRALKIFHEGVKMGSGKCAASLASDFEGFKDPSNVAPSGIDTARAERYRSLGKSLDYYTGYGDFDILKLPNLDKVLPLPPAKLPRWDGDDETLLNAAKAVYKGPKPPVPTKESRREGRYHLPSEYVFGQMSHEKATEAAPHDGFWQPMQGSDFIRPVALEVLNQTPPARYKPGEPFPRLMDPSQLDDRGQPRFGIRGVQWYYVPVIRVWPPAPSVRVGKGLERQAQYVTNAPRCRGDQPCPQSGYWQARTSPEHPLAALVNGQSLRQAWVNQGEPFPHPQTDWRFAEDSGLHATDIAWRLVEPGETMAAIGNV